MGTSSTWLYLGIFCIYEDSHLQLNAGLCLGIRSSTLFPKFLVNAYNCFGEKWQAGRQTDKQVDRYTDGPSLLLWFLWRIIPAFGKLAKAGVTKKYPLMRRLKIFPGFSIVYCDRKSQASSHPMNECMNFYFIFFLRHFQR